MTTSVEATMILADAAQASGGKLYVLGGGWTRLRPDAPTTMAVGIVVHVPYDQTNESLAFTVTLKDADGQPVLIDGSPVAGNGEFEVGRPPGLKAGEQINFPLAVTFNSVSLPPGGYVWEYAIGDDVIGRCGFRAVE